MRTLIIEAASGISGDMFVAAAAPLAGCESEVVSLPAKLGFAGVRCVFRDVRRSGLQCRKFDVLEGEGAADGIAERAPDSSACHSGHAHTHGHVHESAHHHEHRPLSFIRDLIRRAELPPKVRDRAVRMVERLGAVEADVHGIPLEQVQFHEVGAVDSIVDIVAAALCIERLQIENVLAAPICVGSGMVQSAHGRLPIPAPATERLLQGMPTLAGDLPGEWTTPTGALILSELQPKFSAPVLVTLASAVGAGAKDTPQRPNMLRLRLAETIAEPVRVGSLEQDELVVITTNIDNSSGELLGADFIDRLLNAGARDALIHPVLMKKGRPGHQLEVLAEPALAEELAQLILAHTSTIGVRMIPVRRLKLPREQLKVTTPYGEVSAKRVYLPDGTTRTAPEYQSCRELAERAGVPVQSVYRAAAKLT
jgi:hypothetical protein